jgi:hypothetical protein
LRAHQVLGQVRRSVRQVAQAATDLPTKHKAAS